MMRLTPTQGELLRLLAGRDRLHKAHGAGTWTLPGRYGRWAEATVQPLLNDGLLAGDGIDENAQYLAITDRGRAAVPAGSAAGIGGQIAVHCAVDGTLFTAPATGQPALGTIRLVTGPPAAIAAALAGADRLPEMPDPPTALRVLEAATTYAATLRHRLKDAAHA